MTMTSQKVAHVGDVKDGQMKRVRVGGTNVLLLRHAGRLYAVGASCPHYGAPLQEGTLCDGRIICPWHASIFDATTGDLLEPPSLDALPKFSVRVEGDEVYVSVPEKPVDRRIMPMCDCRLQEDGRLFAIGGSDGNGSEVSTRDWQPRPLRPVLYEPDDLPWGSRATVVVYTTECTFQTTASSVGREHRRALGSDAGIRRSAHLVARSY